MNACPDDYLNDSNKMFDTDINKEVLMLDVNQAFKFMPLLETDVQSLPSDSRQRDDVNALKANDEGGAETIKAALEEIQRKDRKLRKD